MASVKFQIAQRKTPCLRVVALEECVQNYLHLADAKRRDTIIQEEYAYKIFPYEYLVKKEERGLEFANELTVLREARDKNLKYVLHLAGVLLDQDYIAIRLPKWEITLREFLSTRRNKY